MTFRKILCLAAFVLVAYGLNLLAANTPLPAMAHAAALTAAAIWLLVELTGARHIAPRPSFYPPNRGFSAADRNRWLAQPAVQVERRRYNVRRAAVAAGFALMALAAAFMVWQVRSQHLPPLAALLVVLALAAGMVFCANAFRLLLPRRAQAGGPTGKDWQPLNPEGLA